MSRISYNRYAIGLFAIGLAFTVYLGVLTGADKQPSRATSALLVVLAAIFQGASAAKFSRSGRADPTLARAAVRRLLRMAARAAGARKASETAFDAGTAGDLRRVVGQLSVELSWIEEGLVEAINDWEEVHREDLRGLTAP